MINTSFFLLISLLIYMQLIKSPSKPPNPIHPKEKGRRLVSLLRPYSDEINY